MNREAFHEEFDNANRMKIKRNKSKNKFSLQIMGKN